MIGLGAALYLVFCISENSNARVFELFVAWSVGLYARPAAAGRPAGALLQGGQLSAGRAGLRDLTYLVIVGASNAVNLTDGWTAWPSCR